MDPELAIALESIVWMLAVGAILVGFWRRKALGIGLVFAYVANLWLIHWMGAAVYLLPWYAARDVEEVELGFRQSAYGICALALGALVLGPSLARLVAGHTSGSQIRMPDRRLWMAYMATGSLCYFVVMPAVHGTATVTALVSSGWHVLLVGLMLACWDAWSSGRRPSFNRRLLLGLSLPLVTILFQGYLGYGTSAAFVLLAFVALFYRPRRIFVLGTLALAYVGLSFYVTYMRDRAQLRYMAWSGQPAVSRLEQLVATLADFEWFDPFDEHHLSRIDDRLNQNSLVGASVNHIESGAQDFARGETLRESLLALIPRAVWPDKPMAAGSGDLVSRYTGIPFSENTSVGVGQVMEFYINFGAPGVIAGFFVLGAGLAVLDAIARQRLVEGDWQGFSLWCLPGIAALKAEGSLVEVTSSAGAAILTALLVNRWLLRRFRGQRRRPVPIGGRMAVAQRAPSLESRLAGPGGRP